jgi:indole-3-glycerol phosphate synthase
VPSSDENDLARSNALLGNPADHDRASAGKLLVGINTRNLRTLEVDGKRLERLAPLLPNARCVAMRSEDPAGLVRDMRTAGSARVAA